VVRRIVLEFFREARVVVMPLETKSPNVL